MRKNVLNLHGSLPSERMLELAKDLTRHYRRTCLLDEFCAARSLSLHFRRGAGRAAHDAHPEQGHAVRAQGPRTARAVGARLARYGGASVEDALAHDAGLDAAAAAVFGVDVEDGSVGE